MRLALHWQILIAICLAVIAGRMAGVDGSFSGVHFYSLFDFIGALFLNALKMIIVPLIVSSMISSISGMSNIDGLGRLGAKTIAFYLVSSLLAILVGLTIVNVIQPGIVNGEPAKEILGVNDAELASVIDKVEGHSATDVFDIFLNMVPPNIVAAAADGQMLGIIFFSLLFGYFVTKIKPDLAKIQSRFWQSIMDVMMEMTNWIMKFAPIGVFGLVAKVIAGIDADQMHILIVSLGGFTLSVLLALAIHVFITMPLILAFIAKVNPIRHYRAMTPALLTAFSTASSSATLPLTMECVRDRAGVSNRTSSFVLPLGATVNMDGTALYECVAAMFIAQAYGLELGIGTQFLIVTVALLTSIGVAGIPAASLVAITIILTTIGLPVEAIGLILAVDRILDMFRTSVNVFSDSCAAVVIARSEGETTFLVDSANAKQPV
ncbi:MAG: dicarboxylate/amino acid:cation symporter [Gammaproteobacteria bacterium]